MTILPRADIVIDLSFGDSGKGATVDALARMRRPDLVVRFGGGAQCAHNVVRADGTHHCFNTHGSALLSRPGVQTYLGPEVLFDPFMAMREATELTKKGVYVPRLLVHPEALVVTPWHVAMNRLREILRGDGRHGSCGAGIGETRSDFLRGAPFLKAKHLVHPDTLDKRLRAIFEYKLMQAQALVSEHGAPSRPDPMADLLLTKPLGVLDSFKQIVKQSEETSFRICDPMIINQAKYLIFEGNQGVLLDEKVGFFPHVTRSETTSEPALRLLKEAMWQGDTHVYGVTRAYGTRHGAGPFPSETSDHREEFIRGEHNALGPWQGSFRTGWFDLPLARYAIEANGRKPDSLVVTCLDRLDLCAKKMVVMRHLSAMDLKVPDLSLPEIELLAHQQAMTDSLFDATPSLKSFSTAKDVADEICHQLGIPEGWNTYSPIHEIE